MKNLKLYFPLLVLFLFLGLNSCSYESNPYDLKECLTKDVWKLSMIKEYNGTSHWDDYVEAAPYSRIELDLYDDGYGIYYIGNYKYDCEWSASSNHLSLDYYYGYNLYDADYEIYDYSPTSLVLAYNEIDDFGNEYRIEEYYVH